MKDKYALLKDLDGEWISYPNNGGDVGDMVDIVDELNLLYNKVKEYEKELDKLKNGG